MAVELGEVPKLSIQKQFTKQEEEEEKRTKRLFPSIMILICNVFIYFCIWHFVICDILL